MNLSQNIPIYPQHFETKHVSKAQNGSSQIKSQKNADRKSKLKKAHTNITHETSEEVLQLAFT